MDVPKAQQRRPPPSRPGSARIAESVTSSSQLSSSLSAHRLHHATSPRPASRAMALPPQVAAPDALRQPALSSFLQEKLQRERRAECEKLTTSPSLSRTEASGSVDGGRFFHNSADAARPRSSTGLELPKKKKGMGVKEMEQAVSNLHKQNFDLKLELFHRRERQSALEERIEALEADREKSLTVADRLVDELDKREKAVEEAVAMIVTLEAEVDRLVRQQTHQGSDGPCNFCARRRTSSSDRPARYDDGDDDDDDDDDTTAVATKTITRMPSFLSDRGDKTENLRNVYLGSRAGSALSLPRVAEASSEAEGATAHALASPTLSVLSESSFVSVYGNKAQDSELASSPPGYVDEPLVLDGFDDGTDRFVSQDVSTNTHQPRQRAASVGRVTSLAKPPPRSSTAVPFQSLSSVMDYQSPLERLMRLDPSACRDDWSKRSSPRAGQATKEEKREALRRVMTDAPGGVRLNDHGMPPTPDTISTSTLHRFKNSDETLATHDQTPLGGALLPAADIRYATESSTGAPLGHSNPLTTKAAGKSHRAAGHRRQASTGQQRPQSARGPRGADRQSGQNSHNGWESDSELSDRRSLESSLDIWLRESAKPDKMGGHISPDLFSFPQDAWAGESAGGASGHALDLRSLRHQLFPWNGGPAPPDRSSSLRAEMGSNADGSSVSAAATARPRHRQSEDQQKRSDVQMPVSPPSPPPSQQQQTGEQKRYPPIAGHHGARAGLGRLFRRSLGGGPPPAPAPSQPAEDEYLPMGVPSSVHRNNAPPNGTGADRSGATPPPIVLNPRQTPRRAESPSEVVVDAEPVAPPVVPQQQQQQQQQEGAGSSSAGGRRKWLPQFGRPGSSRNKGG
ncbi:microtubule associated domain-containing protein [Ophiocordyceps camponoti-floridani]|uniref:Microtubule associated domain-containing protein n=1 Tax=Ophiocordyceps camponoti-floridani TaxID=2030778 RepID=A0A8H4Q550_9HYPO|nr:microtubule associated domain-containing protein [Ophiocordyceps camponoti-floridani]